MKRVFALILALCMTCALFACGKKQADVVPGEENPAVTPGATDPGSGEAANPGSAGESGGTGNATGSSTGGSRRVRVRCGAKAFSAVRVFRMLR